MFSKRPVEDLTYYQIKRFFQNLLKENNDIINNASVETYAFKKTFGERLLAFFNIFLAAMLLSSFILYSTASWRWKLCVMSAIVFITLLALLLYCMDVAKKFSEQYKRQRTYREINIEIHIILANNGTQNTVFYVSKTAKYLPLFYWRKSCPTLFIISVL